MKEGKDKTCPIRCSRTSSVSSGKIQGKGSRKERGEGVNKCEPRGLKHFAKIPPTNQNLIAMDNKTHCETDTLLGGGVGEGGGKKYPVLQNPQTPKE